jgi:hypothetical protein
MSSFLRPRTPLLINLHYSIHWVENITKRRRASSLTGHSASFDPSISPSTTQEEKQYQSQRFPPVTFAADIAGLVDDTGFGIGSSGTWWRLPAPSPSVFLRSVDNTCLERICSILRHTAFAFDRPVNYEVERWFVWTGFGGDMRLEWAPGPGCDSQYSNAAPEVGPAIAGFNGTTAARVNMRGLTAAEIECQLRMFAARGWRDVVRVEMAVEIEGTALGKGTASWRRLDEDA